ncbi:MAG: hypothetical protein QGF31_05775, partial [Nitrospinota bacterium]|nr:hypothetical protein [Nitrospinota bacterium]
IFSFINIMFNLIMHTMTTGMLSGMMALSQASYTASVFLTFFVWLVLVVSDEYYLRITKKVEYELTE